jgi:hypothetical protein
MAGERIAQGVKRTGADVSEHDADGADRQLQQAALMSVRIVPGGHMPAGLLLWRTGFDNRIIHGKKAPGMRQLSPEPR